MKCLDCGAEMDRGTVFSFSKQVNDEFVSETEKEKKGIKSLFKEKVYISKGIDEYCAWHCPNCKKVLIWADSEE